MDEGDTVWEPVRAFVPLQAPEAVQVVAFAELHVSVAADPAWTLDGFAASVSVGTGGAESTRTLAERLSDPPAPVQVSWYVRDVVSGPVDSDPETGFAPDQAPSAVQDSAPVEFQVSVAAVPAATLLGLAASVSVMGARADESLPPPQAAASVDSKSTQVARELIGRFPCWRQWAGK